MNVLNSTEIINLLSDVKAGKKMTFCGRPKESFLLKRVSPDKCCPTRYEMPFWDPEKWGSSMAITTHTCVFICIHSCNYLKELIRRFVTNHLISLGAVDNSNDMTYHGKKIAAFECYDVGPLTIEYGFWNFGRSKEAERMLKNDALHQLRGKPIGHIRFPHVDLFAECINEFKYEEIQET